MLRLIVIIINYTLRYDHYNTPQAQSTVGYRDRLRRTSPAWWRIYFSRDIISDIRSCEQMDEKQGRLLNFQNLIVVL